MLSISVIKNSEAAASYYEQQDDYYSEQGKAQTEWVGEGATALGLAGEVNPAQFKTLLEGRLPDGTELGRGGKDSDREHKAGWDLTFSAPKSVSIVGLAGGDTRLIEAHDAAVKAALATIEKEFVQTRVKVNGQVHTERTGKMVAATFRHETNRNQDPQMHTHAVLMNMTQRADGQWRSLETKEIFQVQKRLGELYRIELAQRVVGLGYDIEKQAGKAGALFEIAGVPKHAIEVFSSRSAEVNEALQEKGLNRDTATAAQKEKAALATRNKKESLDHAQLKAEWKNLASSHGLDLKKIVEKSRHQSGRPGDAGKAGDAVNFAVEKLAERENFFSREALMDEALRFGLGYVRKEDVQREIERRTVSGELQQRTGRIHDHSADATVEVAGYTTAAALERETSMLARLEAAKNSVQPLLSARDTENLLRETVQKSTAKGYIWTRGQFQATEGLLQTTDRIVAVQGYAGTAKTTTVLKTISDELRRQGYAITGMAPTHSATGTLSEALSIDGKTVAKALVDFANANQPRAAGKQAWLVDEASMLSTKQMAELIRQSEVAGARLILVGDTKQLASQEAGAAFRQVQEKTQTFVLDEIVRQVNQDAKSAVEKSIENDLQQAFEHVDRVGGVRELDTRQQRVEAIANDYSKLNEKERERTIVIAPGRDDREELNRAIRGKLQEQGEVKKAEITAATLEGKAVTQAELRDASLYTRGDVLKFSRDYRKHDIAKNSYWTVKEIDQASNTLTLQNREGKAVQINPRQNTKFEVYQPVQRQFAAGDRLVFTQNDRDRGLTNGMEGRVERINGHELEMRFANGQKIKLDLTHEKNRHLNYGYAQTAHRAQGKTSDRVFVHAESNRQNLMNQKSLYVSLSRARSEIKIYTDNRQQLVQRVQTRQAEKQNALDLARGR
ncbi:Multifunctional conjugation protein TraI [Methylophilaceae bacterium]|nr:Multifunctional conjugation protein TraI [Methylophilaceae bacterium]